MASSSFSNKAAPVELFSTSILSNHKVRSRHERYISILSVKKIPFVYHDLASDEEAKSRWRRKARDPQIPGLLVHNEWRGTFEEFEEAVEFGELDLFLKIDESREEDAIEAVITAPESEASSDLSNGSQQQVDPKASSRATSHSVKPLNRLAQPRAPSQTTLAPALPFAPSGSGSRKEHDAERFLSSLGLSDLNLTEEELDEILEAGKSDKGEEGRAAGKIETAEGSVQGSSNGERGSGKYPNSLGIGTSKPAVPRTYIPSAEAGVKPLRLARMGDGNQRSASSISPLRQSPTARFHTSHLSSKALAAEAQASISSRAFSSIRLREAVSKGDKLEDAFQQTRLASKTDANESIVGREDLDDLMASLGLNDVKMSEEEAEAFLLDGIIPSGLDTHGPRLVRAGSVAVRARNEAAAREVARKAKENGFGSESSLSTIANAPTDPTPYEEPPELPEDAKGEDQVEEKAEAEVLVKDEEEVSNVQKEKEENVEVKALETHGAKEEESKEVASEESTLEKEADVNVLAQDADESKIEMETPIAEATPRQSDTELPSASNDTILAKSSDSSIEESMFTVQVQAPSDDIDKASEETLAKETVREDNDISSANGTAQTKGEIEDAEEVSVELNDAAKTGSNEQERALPATPLGEKGSHQTTAKTATEDPAHSAVKDETEAEKVVEQGSPSTSPPLDLAVDQSGQSASPQVLPMSPINRPMSPLNNQAPLSPSILSSLSPSLSPVASPAGQAVSPSSGQTSLSPKSVAMTPSNSQSRRQLADLSSTPSRRAMDITRQASSSSSVSDPTSPHNSSRFASSSPRLMESPKLSEPLKSPRSGTKKFFGLGRRRDSKKKGDESDSEKESSSAAMSPSTSQDRRQKTLSMILKEADEAMQGMSDDDDYNGLDHDDDMGDAFDLELDDGLEENDGMEVAKQ